jgi:hypothetical protein
MRTTSGQRVGLAIVRVWLEADHPSPLRARVTTIEHIAGPADDAVEWSGSEVDAVLVHLRTWLDGWLPES